MGKMNKRLAVSGIISIIYGLLMLRALGILSVIMAMVLIILGSICFYYSDKKMNNEKLVLEIIGVLYLIFLNPISSFLIFLEIRKIIKEEKKNKEPTNKLLILSSILVIFSTMSIMISGTLENITKTLIVSILGIIFTSISLMNDKKFKIKNLSKNYWILGMILLSISTYSVGYFSLLGEYYSLIGQGSSVFIAFLSIIIGVLTFITYKKLNENKYLYITLSCIMFSVAKICEYLIEKETIVLLLMTVILIMVNMFKNIKTKEPVLKVLNKWTVYASFVIGLMSLNTIVNENEFLKILPLAVITLCNLIYTILGEKDIYGTISAIIGGAIIVTTIETINTTIVNNLKLITFIFLAIYVITSLIHLPNKGFMKTSSITINTVIPLIVIRALFESAMLSVLISGTFLFASIIVRNYLHPKIKPKINPLNLILFAMSLIFLLRYYINFELSLCFVMLYQIIIAIIILNKKIKKKQRPIYIGLLFIVLTIAQMLTSPAQPLMILCNMLSAVTGYIITRDEIKKEKYNIVSLVYLLFTFFYSIVVLNILDTNIFMNTLMTLIIYGIIYYQNKESKNKKLAVIFTLLIPLLYFINNIPVTYNPLSENSILMFSSFVYMVEFLVFARNIVKEETNKDKVLTLVTTLILLNNIFQSEYINNVFCGLVLIEIIIYAAKKNYKYLYKEGLILTFVNAVFLLNDIYNELPLWIYLLSIALILLIIAIKKEMDKNK